MSYLTTSELATHLRAESYAAITRSDDASGQAAIDAAMAEAKGYLSRFSTDKIFSARGSERNMLLLTFVKDIAVWHLINLCNAGADYELRERRYERAIDWLKEVQRGNVSPDLPQRDATTGLPDKNNPIGDICYGSNPKRTQHF